MLLRIGIVGDFSSLKRSHWATEVALFHAAAGADFRVEPRWVPTPSVSDPGGIQRLAAFDGLWGAPGSPFESTQGMLAAIQYAREHDLPYLGTCAGFQHALIEFTRSVLGIADADSAENSPESPNPVTQPMRCEGPTGESGPGLAGLSKVTPVASTRFAALCGHNTMHAEFFCSMEPNPSFLERWERAGLHVAARGPDGEMRAFELPNHCFFLGTLFQPQLTSRYSAPHPLVVGFLHACAERAVQP